MTIEKHREFRLNRVFSRPLSALLLKTPVTPNQITFISMSFGLLAGFLFSRGIYSYSILAAASYELAMILDNCDGEIARAKNMKSAFGAWLDIFADAATEMALFSGIAVGLLRDRTQGPVVLFAVLCLSGGLIHFSLVVMEKLKGFGPAVFDAPNPDSEGRKNFIFNLLDALREGDASWFVVLFAAWGRLDYLLWVGGIYMHALWISAFCLNFQWLLPKKTSK